jgi:hypothetical protein
MASGDVYLYSHGNGAIFLMQSDGRSRLVPVGEAVTVAEACRSQGRTVFAGWDETAIARHVVEQITTDGAPITVFEPPRPPHQWNEGTDALMEAAARQTDHILDDLIARGAALDRTDDSGSTALHHAAARGNLHAIERLVAAGATVDVVNLRGFTPRMLAMSTSETAAADLLESLGADPEGHGQAVRFGLGHYGAFYYWVVIMVLFVAALAAFLWPLTLVDGALLLAVVLVYSRIVPPLAFWAGGVPRAIDGTMLELRGLSGRKRLVDLRDVTGAAVGGVPTRSGMFGARYLILGHPGGHRVDARSLRRLNVPTAEVEGVAGHIDRAIVVPVGPSGDEVAMASS